MRHDPLRSARYREARRNSGLSDEVWEEEQVANFAELTERWATALGHHDQAIIEANQAPLQAVKDLRAEVGALRTEAGQHGKLLEQLIEELDALHTHIETLNRRVEELLNPVISEPEPEPPPRSWLRWAWLIPLTSLVGYAAWLYLQR